MRKEFVFETLRFDIQQIIIVLPPQAELGQWAKKKAHKPMRSFKTFRLG